MKVIQIENTDINELSLIIEKIIDQRLNSFFHKQASSKLTVPALSKSLQVSRLTIYNYIKKGLIPAKKVGRKYLIDSNDLDVILQEVKSLKYKRNV